MKQKPHSAQSNVKQLRNLQSTKRIYPKYQHKQRSRLRNPKRKYQTYTQTLKNPKSSPKTQSNITTNQLPHGIRSTTAHTGNKYHKHQTNTHNPQSKESIKTPHSSSQSQKLNTITNPKPANTINTKPIKT